MKVGGKCLSMISIYLLPDCLVGRKVEEDGREPAGRQEEKVGIGWSL